MRRITLWLLSTVAALVLLFSYRTSTTGTNAESAPAHAATAPTATATGGPFGDGATESAGTATGDPSATATGGANATPSRGASSGASGTGAAGGGTAAKTYDGSVVRTRWGPVQVRITVTNNKITDVTAISYPNSSHRDQQINAYALPILREEALRAQSADIDTVSGATVTSDGYRQSLQAAIDAAHL